jgi:hypothetical protein
VKLVKLDKRHTAYGIMKYYVEPFDQWIYGKDGQVRQFQEWRTWCWEAFGPGVERKFVTLTHLQSNKLEAIERWCWHTEDDNMRLYFKDDETASAFSFQWSR